MRYVLDEIDVKFILYIRYNNCLISKSALKLQ
jgi:hypothetical protein